MAEPSGSATADEITFERWEKTMSLINWEDNMKRPLVTIAYIAALCGPVSAADFKFDQQSCYSGPAHLIQHADGITGGSYEGTGMVPGSEGTPFHMLSGRCVGAFTIINGDYNENGINGHGRA
jgi:hypothetical protein